MLCYFFRVLAAPQAVQHCVYNGDAGRTAPHLVKHSTQDRLLFSVVFSNARLTLSHVAFAILSRCEWFPFGGCFADHGAMFAKPSFLGTTFAFARSSVSFLRSAFLRISGRLGTAIVLTFASLAVSSTSLSCCVSFVFTSAFVILFSLSLPDMNVVSRCPVSVRRRRSTNLCRSLSFSTLWLSFARWRTQWHCHWRCDWCWYSFCILIFALAFRQAIWIPPVSNDVPDFLRAFARAFLEPICEACYTVDLAFTFAPCSKSFEPDVIVALVTLSILNYTAGSSTFLLTLGLQFVGRSHGGFVAELSKRDYREWGNMSMSQIFINTVFGLESTPDVTSSSDVA